jgi:hypothetical protein
MIILTVHAVGLVAWRLMLAFSKTVKLTGPSHETSYHRYR